MTGPLCFWERFLLQSARVPSSPSPHAVGHLFYEIPKPLSFRTASAVRNLLVPRDKQVPRGLASETPRKDMVEGVCRIQQRNKRPGASQAKANG